MGWVRTVQVQDTFQGSELEAGIPPGSWTGAEETRRGLKEGSRTEVGTHDWCQDVQETPLGDVHGCHRAVQQPGVKRK